MRCCFMLAAGDFVGAGAREDWASFVSIFALVVDADLFSDSPASSDTACELLRVAFELLAFFFAVLDIDLGTSLIADWSILADERREDRMFAARASFRGGLGEPAGVWTDPGVRGGASDKSDRSEPPSSRSILARHDQWLQQEAF